MSDDKKTEFHDYVVTRKQPLNINNRFIPEGGTVKLTDRAAANYLASGWLKPVPTKPATTPAVKPAVKKNNSADKEISAGDK